jgi:hypothetical protein
MQLSVLSLPREEGKLGREVDSSREHSSLDLEGLSLAELLL